MIDKPVVLLSNERWMKFKCDGCKIHFKIDSYDVGDTYSLYETARCPKCANFASRYAKTTKDVEFTADF